MGAACGVAVEQGRRTTGGERGVEPLARPCGWRRVRGGSGFVRGARVWEWEQAGWPVGWPALKSFFFFQKNA